MIPKETYTIDHKFCFIVMPELQKQVNKGELRERELLGLLDKISNMTKEQVMSAGGVHFEPLRSDKPFWSIRVKQGSRIKCKLSPVLMMAEEHPKAQVVVMLLFDSEHYKKFGFFKSKLLR